jgi:predicted Zn finger-like uncharacterized protein
MALATICPHCNTTFRVASDQLKLRGGIVRCGACNEVFDGNAALIDLAAIAAHQAGAAAAAALHVPVPVPGIAPPDADVPEPSASAAFDAEVAAIDARQTEEVAQEEPIYTLDFDTTFDPFGILPKSLHPTPEPKTGSDPVSPPLTGSDPVLGQPSLTGSDPVFEPSLTGSDPVFEPPLTGSDPVFESPLTGSDPVLGQQVDEEILALPMLNEEFEEREEAPAPPATPPREHTVEFQPPLLMRASAAAEPAPPPPAPQAAVAKPAGRNAARRKKIEPQLAAPVVVVAEPEPGEHEPEFVRQSRLKEQTGRTRRIVLGAGSALLVLALAAQGVVTFRNGLAARYPQARPMLAGACAMFGCKVELPAQIDALSVETGELQSLGANTFSFTTLLRNQGSLVQAWPHLELALTDANDKPLVRRVFTPAEYLAQGVAPAKGFGPRSEQPVKLFFELNQVKASGYHIAIFYP